MPAFIKGSVSDSLYVRFSESPISVSVELHPDVILDVDVNGTVVGIDFQHVAELMAEAQTVQGIGGMGAAAMPGEVYSPPEQLQGVGGQGRLVYQAA